MDKSALGITSWFNSFRAIHKLLFSLGVALLVSLVLIATRFEILTGIMVCWDTFSLCLISLTWITIFMTNGKELREIAIQQDESRYAISLIVLFSVCLSIAGILIIFRNNNKNLVQQQLHTMFCMLGVALSWVLLHTTFTLRYAHIYYAQRITDKNQHVGGLRFPGDEESPHYLDFAYFSFVIGMTFQVSDVEVVLPRMRRLVLVHSLISFIFNTIIVALTINTIADISR